MFVAAFWNGLWIGKLVNEPTADVCVLWKVKNKCVNFFVLFSKRKYTVRITNGGVRQKVIFSVFYTPL